MDSAVSSSNAFSLRLLLECRKETPQATLFYSPASIAICLSMLQTGAKEDTKKQIEQVLCSGDNQFNEEGFGLLSRYLQEFSGPVALKATNILAVDQQYTIHSEFLDNLKENYNSEIKQLPFQSDPEKSRKEINRLIEEATNGKIKDTLVPGTISAEVKLVLANAIYFNGKWKDQFDSTSTEKKPFYTINKETVMVDMMFKMQSYKYIHSKELKADMIEIPYVGERVSLIILLPSQRYGLPLLEKGISVQKINHSIGKMCVENGIMLGLPKFKLEVNISLKEHLCNLGMTQAFTEDANLSGISSEGNLFVSSALHKTFLDINEEGTEAAAATSIVYSNTCIPPPPQIRFSVDHPFMMFIRESTTGLILFSGSIQHL